MKTEKLKFRHAEADDLGNIMRIMNSWAPDDWDWKHANQYYKKYFCGNYQNDQVFVGSVNNKIVSVTGYCPDVPLQAGIYWLNWFYTHKNYIGNKYGHNSLDFVIKDLKNKKAKKLFIDTTSHEFYIPALNLYLKHGFSIIEKLPDYYEKGEDKIILSKHLNE